MTMIFSASLAAATGEVVFYNWMQTCISAGWTVPSSSNGTLWGAVNYISTSSALAVSNAWFILKQPLGATGSYGGVRRELAIRRGTTSRSWLMLYSYSSSFTGSAGVSALPSASDAVRVIGNESMIAFDTSFLPADAGYKVSCMADNASPYGTYFVCVPNGGAQPTAGFIMDPMYAGTTSSLDTDPYVFYPASSNATTSLFKVVASTNTPCNYASASVALTPLAYLKKGLPGQFWVGMPMLAYSVFNAVATAEYAFGTGGTTNPHDGNDDTVPIIYSRPSTAFSPQGYKGVSSMLRWKSANRSTGDTISTVSSGSKDLVVMQDIIVPWNGTDMEL